MKKLMLAILLCVFTANIGECALKSKEINILNLKENSMYILSLKSKALNVNVNDNKINVYPIVSIENDGKQIFVDAKKSGVFDVSIKTEKEDYQIRFIVGSTFEQITDDITLLDVPTVVKEK